MAMFTKSISFLFFISILLAPLNLKGQFSPPAGMPGSDAIHADSNLIIAWASEIEITRGFVRIDNPSDGTVNYGAADAALGKADLNVVSLGDAGYATIFFEVALRDGTGADFVVFENSFSDDFIELAHVEASSDGEHFVRFPSVSLTSTTEQIGTFGTIDATKIHNLAGKYRGLFGVPFDLGELGFDDQIDLENVTHIRILDVVGSINATYASYDSQGNVINDPFPTPFPSGGFDLDAIGVINNKTNLLLTENSDKHFIVYPNPVLDVVYIETIHFQKEWFVEIVDAKGQSVTRIDGTNGIAKANTEYLPTGVFFIYVFTSENQHIYKLIKL